MSGNVVKAISCSVVVVVIAISVSLALTWQKRTESHGVSPELAASSVQGQQEKKQAQATAEARGQQEKKQAETTAEAFPRLEAVSRSTVRMWSVEELAEHKGENPNKPLLLCILGEVYDVGPGERFYAPDKGYHDFAGRDQSRLFADTEIESEDTSKVIDLPREELNGVLGWQDFYRKHNEYRFVGFLEGRYFDSDGAPTEENLQLQEIHGSEARSAEVKKKLMKRFMGCNSKHVGGAEFFELWCDDSYHRPGSVPLHLYWTPPGAEKTAGWCACLPPQERSKADADSAASAGTFRLVHYPECEVGKQRCRRPKGALPP